jgi:glycosyltransferase involved in cell wall biosynthesis
MKKIGFFISCINMLGGTEKATIQTANKMAQNGNDVTIISLFKHSKINSFEFELNANVKIKYVYENQKYGALPLSLYFLGKRIYERRVNQILNTIDLEYLIFPQTTMFFKPKKKIKLISLVHSSYEYFKKTKIAYKHLIKNIDKMDKILFLTDECKNQFNAENNSDKAESQKNINNLKIVQSEKENLIVYIGRIDSKTKQIEQLVSILNKVEFKQYRVEIYGKGPDEKIMDQITNPKVKFMGPTNNPLEIFAKSKICLLTSKFEGTPIALVEAISTGNVIISYNCSAGIRQLVKHNSTGIIIENNNQLLFQQELEKIMIDPKRMAELSANSLYHFETEYSDDLIYQKWLEILN